jgi:hypothetical protein
MDISQRSFDDATLAKLQQAYDEACREAGLESAPGQAPWISEARAKLAATIMDLATAGERDPNVLKRRALEVPLMSR